MHSGKDDLEKSATIRPEHGSRPGHDALRLVGATIKDLGWRYSVFVVACVCLASIALLPPELFRYFTTQLTSHSQSKHSVEQFLQNLLLFGGLIGFALFVSSYGSILMREWLRLAVEANLRRRVLKTLHGIPLETLDEAERGEWMTKMTGDLASVENFVTESIPQQLRELTIVFGVGIVFLVSYGVAALIPIGTAIVLAVANYVIQRRIAPVLGELRTINGSIFQSLIENFEGKKTIRSQGAEASAVAAFEEKIKRVLSSGMRVVKVIGVLMGANRTAAQIMITLVLTAVAWSMLGEANLSLADALIVPFYIGLFFNGAQTLAAEGYSWNRFLAEGARLAEVLMNPRYADQSAIANDSSGSLAHLVVVDSLLVGFRPCKVVAGPIQASLLKHQMTVFLGASGCGKSTTLEVLAGLRAPLAGTLELLGQGGETLWRHSGHDYALVPRSLGAYVEQRPYIFAGSLRDNLAFGFVEKRSDQDLMAALQKVHLDRFARDHGGLDYRIFDRGENLSEGQRYRLAIARAILTSRPFILLDEPFAAIDEETMKVIVSTLNELKAVRGVVLVTHYLPKDLAYDQILNFDRLAESGRSMELDESRRFANFSSRLSHTSSHSGVRDEGNQSSVVKSIDH